MNKRIILLPTLMLVNLYRVILKRAYLTLLLGVCLAGCQFEPANTDVTFDIQYRMQSLDCAANVKHSDRQWQVKQFSWFLSDIQIHQNGQWQTVDLQVNDWQTDNTALLMLPGDCEAETPGNLQLRLANNVSLDGVDKMAFSLGVPFKRNHANPLQQPSPLNLPFMFWSWQGGHKFLRLDLQSQQGSWAFHLGSTGCQSDSRVRSPAQPCEQPNLFRFEAPLTAGNRLNLKLDVLLHDQDLSFGQGCTFHYGERQRCQQLLDNLNPLLFGAE